jgi:hypothetical protein
MEDAWEGAKLVSPRNPHHPVFNRVICEMLVEVKRLPSPMKKMVMDDTEQYVRVLQSKK